jgi:toxin ParE1/3/4
VARADVLGDFPEMGRINPKLQELGVRELSEAPYRIFYRIEREKVEIIGVVHGARDF